LPTSYLERLREIRDLTQAFLDWKTQNQNLAADHHNKVAFSMAEDILPRIGIGKQGRLKKLSWGHLFSE
jgi:hypothetical protein